jgi:hypothetical protein
VAVTFRAPVVAVFPPFGAGTPRGYAPSGRGSATVRSLSKATP